MVYAPIYHNLQIIIIPQETVAACENRFTRELNEKEVIELLEDLSSILGAFLIKQLFHSRMLDIMMRARGIVVNYKAAIAKQNEARGQRKRGKC